MIKGLYAAASAMLAGLTRQNTLAHNLSNIDTPGFRQVMLSLDDFMTVPVSSIPGFDKLSPGLNANPVSFLGRLGLGVDTPPETTDFTQGALKQTGEPLDLAIQGAGFFRVRTPNGERYTRDGRFIRDVNGQLVTVDGYAALNNAGAPISLPEGTVSVAQDGTLAVNGQPAGQLGLAAFANPETELERDLPNTFAAAGAPTGTGAGTVQQGYLETANVNPAQLMTQMVAVGRAYEAAQQLVHVQDDLLGRAIATLGRL